MAPGGSLPLLRVFGIRVGVTPSWFIVLFLVIFLLWDAINATLDASDTTIYVVAVIAAASFFGSIVLHELGHALAARREGIEVAGIDLFLFGGMMKMSRDTQTAGQEFRVAAAGPAVTLLILLVSVAALAVMSGGAAVGDSLTLDGVRQPSAAEIVVSLVVSMNLFVLIFNLVPAFPLDGGRIARAIAWRVTGDRGKATRFSARIGVGFGGLLIVLGVVLLATGEAFDGIWFAALGWLLAQGARAAIAQTAFTDRLAGITVADIMDADPVTIPADLSAVRAYEEFFLRYQGWEWFAVVEADGRYAGLAHRAAVEHAALEREGALPVRDLAAGNPGDARVAADAPLESLLSSEPLRRLGALMAVDRDGRLRGVVTTEQVARALKAQLA